MEIRQSLPRKIRNSGNVGVAKLEIEGLPDEMKAHSRLNKTTDEGSDGFVLLRDKDEWIFTPQAVDPDNMTIDTPDAYSRKWDTEIKILNEIALKVGDNPNVTGKTDLYTEREPCASCSSIIEAFKARYQNIELNMFFEE